MIRQAISCDICGTEKRQTNHWYVAYEQGGELRLGGLCSSNRNRPASKHLCGQTCVHKLVDEYLAKVKASRPAQVAEDVAAELAGQYAGHWHTATQPSESDARFDGAASNAPTRAAELMVRRAEKKKEKHLRVESAPITASLPVNEVKNEVVKNPVRELSAEQELIPAESSARLLAPSLDSLHDPTEVSQAVQPITSGILARNLHPIERKESSANSNHRVIELPLVDEPPGYSTRRWRAEAWERERARELREGGRNADSSTRLRTN